MREFAARVMGLGTIVATALSSIQLATGQVCNDGLACEYLGEPERGSTAFRLDDDVPVLAGFDLGYRDTDHHVRTVAVGAQPEDPGLFRLELTDNGEDKPVRAWARYFRLGRSLADLRRVSGIADDTETHNLRFVTRRGCRGSCTIDIPGFDKTRFRFFLSGFRFSFNDGDRHLRHIRVWPVGDIAGSRGVYTSFADNAAEASYDVTLAYVLLPLDYAVDGVLYGGKVSEVDPGGAVSFPRPNLSGRALSGFGASYSGDDEHLRQFAVEVNRGGGRVILRDNDARESIVPYIAAWRLPVE